MTLVKFLGRDWDIAPYKLGPLRQAAPFVDAQKARQQAIGDRLGIYILASDTPEEIRSKSLEIANGTTMEEMLESMADAVRVLHVGIARIDPSVTVDMLLDDIDPTPQDFAVLIGAMNIVLGKSGLHAGELVAPAGEAQPGASSEVSAG